jgi:DNA-directed RNA polymerase specialized sigma24 family protein
MFDSYGSESDAEGGPGFSVSWRGGDADYQPWRFDSERPWALYEIAVSGDRDGYETPDPHPEAVEEARRFGAESLAGLTPKQRLVLELAWGIGQRGDRQYSFREIAAYMSVSWQAVQAIYNRAIGTLRRRCAV